MSLDKNQLLQAYRAMKTIRVFEDRISLEFKAGNIPGFVHLYAGQEAIAVGVCLGLTDEDYIASTHRGHGHCIAKGCDVKAMMLEIMGKAGGSCGGKGGSMHIADLNKGMLGANAIVGGGPPLTVGAALSCKTLENGKVSVSFTGDGGSNQGTTFEAMNLAVVLQVPAIFIFENNGYGEGTGACYAVGSNDIAGRAAGFGLPAEKIDGADFFAVYTAASKAIKRARDGGGPSAIEASITRFYGHFEGDSQAYRPKGEVKRLREELDCLTIFRQKVLAEDLLNQQQLDQIDSDVEALIEEAAQQALAASYPELTELTTHVYASAY